MSTGLGGSLHLLLCTIVHLSISTCFNIRRWPKMVSGAAKKCAQHDVRIEITVVVQAARGEVSVPCDSSMNAAGSRNCPPFRNGMLQLLQEFQIHPYGSAGLLQDEAV